MQTQMHDELKFLVQEMTAFQRLYCEFRARGFSQGQSALRAGSTAAKESLKIVGHQVENVVGAKDYIEWLKQERAKSSIIDRVKVLEMLNDVYKESMSSGEYKEANNAAKLIGMALGLFDHKNNGVVKQEDKSGISSTKNNTDAFKENEEELDTNETNQKYKELQDMIKELNKSK